MRTFLLGLAIAALASAGPAFADDKKQSNMKNEGSSGSASMQKNANEGRGGLEEWPVSQEPADWSHVAPDSATTGESTGASGSGISKSSEH